MPPSTEMCISTARRLIRYVNIFKEIIYLKKKHKVLVTVLKLFVS